MSDFIATYGAPFIFLVVFLGASFLPWGMGELALVTGAALAQGGDIAIYSVIGAATTGAITGQATAYVLGRWRGRRILEWGPLGRLSARPLALSEAFFAKHGGKAVFLGRFVPVLRTAVGWVAAVSGLSWWRYMAWNVSGALVWAFGIGLSAYFFGKAAVEAAQTWGTIGIVIIVVVAAVILVIVRYSRREVDRRATGELEVREIVPH
jgi:membrane protein DedA with SNARE-associated domain